MQCHKCPYVGVECRIIQAVQIKCPVVVDVGLTKILTEIKNCDPENCKGNCHDSPDGTVKG